MEYREDNKNLQSALIHRQGGCMNLQELITTILDKLPLGVFVKDAADHFTYLYWNRFMEEITGIDTSHIEGHTDFEIRYDSWLTPEERAATDRRIMETGRPAEFHSKIKDTRGQYRHLEITKYPLALADGHPLLLVLWRDITRRLEVEHDLRRTRMLTNMALQTSDIRISMVVVEPDSPCDYDDTLICLNDWQSNSGAMVKYPWPLFASCVHPDDYHAYCDTFKRLCKGEIEDLKAEIRIRYNPSGDYCWRETDTHVYERDEKGRPTILLGCSTNIQERKNQELSLEVAKSRAEAADKMKSKYLADMSHEIRTPLSAITGFSELMAFAETDEERLSYYEIIKTNNQLLMQLINDILDLSKIEADAIQINYSEVNVNDLMDTIFASAKLRAAEGVEIRLEKGAETCLFGTDPVRLLQLVNNLVNNAIKNTPEGSITMGYTPLAEGNLRFYVKDTGVGIPPEKLRTLFQRFVKLNDYVEGIGLGLAICQGLVTKMGGSIEVTSEEGVGSTFSFVLPPHTAP